MSWLMFYTFHFPIALRRYRYGACVRFSSASTSTASTLPASSISVCGLTLTNCTSAGIVSSREYDALGRVVASTDGRGNTTTLSYDAQGRIAWREDALGNRTTFGYDPLGRQVASTATVAEGAGSPVPLTTHTAYDAENRVVSTWGATYPVAYAYGCMAAMTTYRDEAMQNGDTTTWLYDEPTGLLTNKVSADGTVIAHREYDPFGGTVVQSGVPRHSASGATAGLLVKVNPFRFSTKHWNDLTGLGYWGYRWYSSGS